MKKIILTIGLAFLVLGGVSFGQEDTDNDGFPDAMENTTFANDSKNTNNATTTQTTNTPEVKVSNTPGEVTKNILNAGNNKEEVENALQGKTNNTQTPVSTENIVTENCEMQNGIKVCSECLMNDGQCEMSISQLLGIRKSVEEQGTEGASATLFVQDIILSATFFIGTVVTIAIIISGISYVMAGASGKDPSKAKSGLIYSIIGLILVVSSYAIIRLVQYIAKGF